MKYSTPRFTPFRNVRFSGINPPALAVIALILAASLFMAEPALAMNFVVTDEAGLADAINQSNAMPLEDNVIEIDLHGAIVLTAPLPNIRSNVEIFGPGRNELLLSGGNRFRVFFVESGTVSGLLNGSAVMLRYHSTPPTASSLSTAIRDTFKGK